METSPHLGTSRVLVIEDEPVVQQLLREALRDVMGEPLMAASCAEARTVLETARELDVVLMDKNLPDGSAFEILPVIRARQPEAEIILITAYASLDSAIQAVAANVFDYLPKPFDSIDDVIRRVRNAAAKASLGRERNRLFRELSESEARYRQLFEESCDAILVWNQQNGRIVDANTGAVRLYGYGKPELLAMKVDGLRAGPAPAEVTPAAGFRTRRDRAKDGSTITVETTAGSFSAGDRRMVVEVVRDIGERLRAEATRRELEEQLRQAQKMEALGRLAGGVAHDFNNVLAIIMCYSNFVAEALAKRPELTEALDDCRQVIAAGETAVSLTRQLLAFSRKQVVTPEVIDLNELVMEVRQLLRRTLGEHIEIVAELQPVLPRVRLDRTQAVQVLTNLAVNARDAMPAGGRLAIATALQDGAVVLRVSDTGCGIPPEALPSIFDPFFTTKETGKGTGLGLATVYGIITHAGGSIDVVSRPDAGSTFTIRLPGVTAPGESTRGASAVPESVQGHGETVLVVEDDPAVLSLVRRMLERAGYRVLEARGGSEALERGRAQGRLDLLLTDIVMPGMSGTELARRLQAETPTRVIFMSGYATEPVLQRSVVSARTAFLPKPFTEEQMLTLVRQVLEASGPHVAPPES